MAKERLETGKAPVVRVERCAGDLVVRLWLDRAVAAEGEYAVEQNGDELHFVAEKDLVLAVPEGSSLIVGDVQGDCVIKGLQGAVTVERVSGDLVLSTLSTVKAGVLEGDLLARDMNGALVVEKVQGDVALRNIGGDVGCGVVLGDLVATNISGALRLAESTGDLSVQTVNGDLEIKKGRRDVNIRNLGGVCHVQGIQGDIRLQGGLSAGKHTLEAGGDIVVRWPVEAPLLLEATAGEIRNRLPLVDITGGEGSLAGRLGDGDTILRLRAGGRIMLNEARLVDEKWRWGEPGESDMSFAAGLVGLGEQIGAEVTRHIARIGEDIDAHFGTGFGEDFGERVSLKAAEAARKAEEAAGKARQRAEREAARRAQARQSQEPASSATSQEPPSRKASAEEQLKILRMVEKGTISPEDAELLLRALEE